MAFETILTDELIEKYTSAGHWVDHTITDYLDDWAEHTPDKVAFIDSRREVSYGQLRSEVDRCALACSSSASSPAMSSPSSCPTGSTGSSCTTRALASGS